MLKWEMLRARSLYVSVLFATVLRRIVETVFFQQWNDRQVLRRFAERQARAKTRAEKTIGILAREIPYAEIGSDI